MSHEILLRFRDWSDNSDYVAVAHAEGWELADDGTLRLLLTKEQYSELWKELGEIRVVDGRPVAFFSSSSSWAADGKLRETLWLAGARRQNPDISPYVYVDGEYRKEVA